MNVPLQPPGISYTHYACFLRLVIRVPQDLFTAGAGFSTHFSTIFTPIAGEFDLIGKHPEADPTIKNVDKYFAVQEELRTAVSPELELIESRIIAPMKEFREVLKSIRKSITKRDHKVCRLCCPREY